MLELKIEGYPQYLISNDGKVFATHLGKYLNCYDNGIGYLAVKLRDCTGKRKQFYIHRLVASAYLPNPDKLPDVNHKDCNKSNNCSTNLEWSSHTDNLKHAFKAGKLSGAKNIIIGYNKLIAE